MLDIYQHISLESSGVLQAQAEMWSHKEKKHPDEDLGQKQTLGVNGKGIYEYSGQIFKHQVSLLKGGGSSSMPQQQARAAGEQTALWPLGASFYSILQGRRQNSRVKGWEVSGLSWKAQPLCLEQGSIPLQLVVSSELSW